MAVEELEPRWVVDLRSWWQGIVGPMLTDAWASVSQKAGSNTALEKGFGALVRKFERELVALEQDVGAFEALAGTTEWAPYAGRARETQYRIMQQWKDPGATMPTRVSGPGLIAAKAAALGVVRGINVTVTAIGVAWAVACLADVVRTRKLLKRWAAHIEDGVHPSRRDRRKAHLEGVAGVAGRGRARRAPASRGLPDERANVRLSYMEGCHLVYDGEA